MKFLKTQFFHVGHVGRFCVLAKQMNESFGLEEVRLTFDPLVPVPGRPYLLHAI